MVFGVNLHIMSIDKVTMTNCSNHIDSGQHNLDAIILSVLTPRKTPGTGVYLRKFKKSVLVSVDFFGEC